MSFSMVIGHDRVKGLLAQAVSRGRLPPALLFSGPEGVGKRTLALAVGQAAVCEDPQGEACGRCSCCRRVARSIQELPEMRLQAQRETRDPVRHNHRLHPDLMLVEPSRFTAKGELRVTEEIKIDQIRDLVREVRGSPFEGRARAFVVDHAHAITEQAANALLKSLEEPPPSSHILLVTPSPQALLPTIRSRCQQLRFGPLPAKLLEAHLQRTLEETPESCRLRATLAGGSLGRALAFDWESYRSLRDELLGLLESVPTSGPLERLEAAETFVAALAKRDADDPALALTTLRGLLRDVAALRAGVAPGEVLNPDAAERLAAVVDGPLGGRAAELAQTVGETRAALRGNANKLLAMDLLMDRLSAPAGE
jgi:DNA polymerase-3 subunit delta'